MKVLSLLLRNGALEHQGGVLLEASMKVLSLLLRNPAAAKASPLRWRPQ